MKKLMTIFASLFISHSAAASQKLEIVVPVLPGGGSDMVTRVIADALTQTGTKTVVKNIVGGQRITAMNYVVDQPADGSVIFLGSTGDVILLPLQDSPSLRVNHTDRGLVPVAYAAHLSPVLVVNPNVPVSSLKEFLTHVSNDAKFTIGSVGQLHDIIIQHIYGLGTSRPNIVKYNGDQQMMADIIAGHIPAGLLTTAAATGMVQSGRLKALAVTTSTRSPGLPSVAAVNETTPMDFRFWWGFFAPPNTPQHIIDDLNKKINAALTDPNVQERLSRLTYSTNITTSKEFTKFYQSQIDFFAKQLKK